MKSKYRFKTKEEFIRDGEWDDKINAPKGWEVQGYMNHFLGQDVPEIYNEKCDKRLSIFTSDWHFASSNYVLKETKDTLPEYVECVIEIAGCYGKKGKIYKVITWKHGLNDCMLEGTTSGSTDRSRFKPSTKEAYDAQNASVVDKWAIKCTEENKEHLEKFFHSKGSEYVGYAPSWNVSIRHYYHYPQQEIGLWGHIAIQKDYREITNEEFYKIAGVNESEFEKGKWYKYRDHIGKFSHYKEGLFVVSEYVYKEKHYTKTCNWGGKSEDYKRELLTDLSEIQPYLPDGHPDKFLIAEQKSQEQSSIPQYVKCINDYGNAFVGKIYRTDDEYQAKKLFGMTWEQVLIEFKHFGTKFIPATYLEYSEHHSEKAEQSKSSTDGYPIKKETLIEDVHSVSVMLSTKSKSKQFKF